MANLDETGFHLEHEIFVLDANLSQTLNSNEYDSITRSLVTSFLRELDMYELGPLQIYPAVDMRAPGWSFVQSITTSHISGHYFEKPGPQPHIHMDFYSCKKFDWRKIIEIANEHLHMSNWCANFLCRSMNINERIVLEISGNENIVNQLTEIKPSKLT